MRYLNILYVKETQRDEAIAKLERLKDHNSFTPSTFPIAGKWYCREDRHYYILFSCEPLYRHLPDYLVFTLDQFERCLYNKSQRLSRMDFGDFMASTKSLNLSIVERVELWKGMTLSLVPEDIEFFCSVFVCSYEKFASLDIDTKKSLLVNASEMKMTKNSYVVRMVTVDSPVLSIVSSAQIPLIIKDLTGKPTVLQYNVSDHLEGFDWIEDEVARDIAMTFISKPII